MYTGLPVSSQVIFSSSAISMSSRANEGRVVIAPKATTAHNSEVLIQHRIGVMLSPVLFLIATQGYRRTQKKPADHCAPDRLRRSHHVDSRWGPRVRANPGSRRPSSSLEKAQYLIAQPYGVVFAGDTRSPLMAAASAART